MNIEIIQTNPANIAILKSADIEIKSTQDALDLMAEASDQNANRIIIREENLLPEFFDLKSGIAGEILQKFVTYGIRLTIIGDFTKYQSKSLKDFIYESNKGRQINFLATLEEAVAKLAKE